MVEQRRDGSQEEHRPHAIRWLLILTVSSVALFASGIVVLTILYALTLVPELPRLKEVRNPDLELTTFIYAADGQEIARYYRKNRIWIGYNQISPTAIEALLATEDHRFYEHWGIDLQRLLSSAYKTARGDRQGGSTITMQLSRNLYPDIQNSWPGARKLKEIMTAFKIERHYEKTQILEMYLNTVPFGYNAFGIEAAAQTYFDKLAADLTVSESATLIGMLKATSRYNPVRNPESARLRRNIVLDQMVKYGSLDASEAAQLKESPVEIEFEMRKLANSIAPHFAEYVRSWLHEWAEQRGYNVYEDGLRVHTTLDPRLQKRALEAVEKQMDGLQAVVDFEWSRSSDFFLGRDTDIYKSYKDAGRFKPFSYFWNTRTDIVNEYVRDSPQFQRLINSGKSTDDALSLLREDARFMDSLRVATTRLEVGLVAFDPNSGEVKAWVGGRDFNKDQYDKVGISRRQPGSTFKPFLYAAAIDYGYSPYYTFRDTLYSIQLTGSNKTWTPRNSSGRYSGEDVTLREALTYSKNTVTAQLMSQLGPHLVSSYARRLGIESNLDPVPSLALGTSEVTLLELVNAYVTLSSYGIRRQPVFVTRIEDQSGRVLETFQPQSDKAISTYTAYTLVDMLRDVIDQGTGSPIRWKYGIREDVAGKTGTTQNGADGWFVMMHPQLVTGSWVGFNDRRITFRSSYWGQGGHNALNVVGDFFRRTQRDPEVALSDINFVPPPGYREPEPPDTSYYQNAYESVYDDSLWVDEYLDTSWDSNYESSQYETDLEENLYRTIEIEVDSLNETEDLILEDTLTLPGRDSSIFPNDDEIDPDSDVERILRNGIKGDSSGTDRIDRIDSSSTGLQLDSTLPEIRKDTVRGASQRPERLEFNIDTLEGKQNAIREDSTEVEHLFRTVPEH